MGTRLLFTGILLGSLGVLPFQHTALPDAARIDNALNEFYHKYPQETIALLTDREAYSPGETIWFSGYCTCLGKPSPVSKVLYVELTDSTGVILHRSILPVEEGATEGHLSLPDEFPAGRYQLRAYTSWMLNFDPAFFFHKELRIADSPVAEAGSPSPEYKLEWFPEGGNLVEGLTSQLAFRARTSDGHPIDITGKLIDSSGKPIRIFNTLHDGLGSFVIHPAPGNSYTALVDFPGGVTKKIPLPAIQPSGVVLYINHFLAANGNDSIYYRLSRSVAEKEKYQHLILCAEMQGKTDYTYINFDNDFAGNYNNIVLTAPSPLSVDGFPAGVLHLTVFDEKDQPLAQRLVYLQRTRDRLTPTLTRDTSSLDPHGRNHFRLDVPGDAAGVYTVSVTPADEKNAAKNNILSTLLLSADLQNETNDWTWFYRDRQPETLHALDLLLLTSRWTRFDWNKILHGDYPSIHYYAEQSLVLKGQAFWGNGKDKRPMHNGQFSLMVKAPSDSLFDMISVPVDSEGRFSLVNLNFHDTAAVYVQNNNTKKGREVSVLFDRDPLDTIRLAAPLPDVAAANPNTTALHALDNKIHTNLPALAGQHKQKDTTVLSTALVRAHRKSRTDSLIENYATGMFANPGAWAKTIDLTDDKVAENDFGINVIQYLVGRVAGLIIKGAGSQMPLIAWRINNGLLTTSDQSKQYMMNAPAFFLNEQLLNVNSENYESAMAVLTQISIPQVAMIRVFQPGTFAAVPGMAPHGVIAIYTKNGSESKFHNIPTNFNKMKKTGYDLSRTFTASRRTLYWNPALSPDSVTHTATFSFSNDDKPGPFRVTIQGLDRNGRPLLIDSVFTK
ncbi:MAG TPA: hypothetical protein VGM89_05690 [Puia sp.]